MKTGLVAFAFGVPNTLRSNRSIAAAASAKAVDLGCPLYTQRDILPIAPNIELELVQEDYPRRVPTLRIALGAVRWAIDKGLGELWVCAADAHLPRCLRDVRFALQKANAAINVRVCTFAENYPPDYWFCEDSLQADTRKRWRWRVRDAILMNLPIRFYAFIAS
jgi:hypothetical protein